MHLLIFDTETTGLPKSRAPSIQGPNNWPHMVSISWVVLNTDTNRIDHSRSYTIQPRGWTIPDESIRIHGITQEKAMMGADLKDVMTEFLSEQYDALVAHNLDFDFNVLHNAVVWDLGMPFDLANKRKMCTMELSKDLCNIKNKFGNVKYPKLIELYEYTFNSQPNVNELHTSIYDTNILVEIIQHCKNLRLKMNLSTTDYTPAKNAGRKNENRVLSINFESS